MVHYSHKYFLCAQIFQNVPNDGKEIVEKFELPTPYLILFIIFYFDMNINIRSGLPFQILSGKYCRLRNLWIIYAYIPIHVNCFLITVYQLWKRHVYQKYLNWLIRLSESLPEVVDLLHHYVFQQKTKRLDFTYFEDFFLNFRTPWLFITHDLSQTTNLLTWGCLFRTNSFAM